MKKILNIILTYIVLTLTLIVTPVFVRPVKAAIPVIDGAALGQWVDQITKMLEVISNLNVLKSFVKLDHENLSVGQWRNYLSQFNTAFDEITEVIEGYQEGGLLGQLERIDEVYFPYHEGWETANTPEYLLEANENITRIRKQMLWTRIQFKHAGFVAGKIREQLPRNQAEIEQALKLADGSAGLMQAVKAGHQIAGLSARSLENLNVQIGELIQAQVGQGMEQNMRRGIINNRISEAIEGWDEQTTPTQSAPTNPFGAY